MMAGSTDILDQLYLGGNVFEFRALHHGFRVAFAILAVSAAVSFEAVSQAPAGNSAGPPSPGTSLEDELNSGVAAYKTAHYEEAIAHFRRAVELDPGSTMAKVYLATALAQNVVPGLDTPENLQTARVSIAIFQEVLERTPHDVNSMKQIAGIYFSVKQLEEAKTWQKKVLEEDPRDPEAAYTIGVIDWNKAHQNVLKAMMPAGVIDDGEGNLKAPPQVLETIKSQNSALVEEALQYLNQALESRPEYDDAMAYMNLVYRRKADLDWQDDAARQEDLARAKEWARKAMETRKANEERRMSGPPAQNN